MRYDRLARQLVRALRGRRSQAALSRRLGYRTNVVYTWEAGRRWPTGAELLRLAARVGVDVGAALRAFYGGAAPPWLRALDPTSREAVAALLSDLRGQTPIGHLAERASVSRYAVSRWLGGATQPRLPDFLRLVEAASLRLLDLLATIVDPSKLPEAARPFAALVAHRKAAYEMPHLPAVLRAIELADYGARPAHEPGWIARRLGPDVLPPEAEAEALDVLERAGQIRREGEGEHFRFVPSGAGSVDTRQDEVAVRRLKTYWARVGLGRIEAGAPGQFSFNVFSVSRADMDRLRELHLGYFRALRSIVADSRPGEHVAVANVQLFSLGGAWPDEGR